jgi:methyltransferase (TIGR00027 family)
VKPGHESQTAIIVCAARAAAHGRTEVAAFADPTALALLPEPVRQRVEQFRAGVRPTSLRGRIRHAMFEGRSRMMVARTVAIDRVIRAAASPQVVILGAGLDGRAWRMPELANAIVFEVDHPDSQRTKRARAASLSQAAREIRFVPVDFTRDRLDDALAAAGHDPAQPTTWIWEGVIMYLAPADIAATLRVVAARSAANSRLVAVYHSHSIVRKLIGFTVSRLGEPLRSAFTAAEMRGLLARYGFHVVDDDDVASIAAKLAIEFPGSRRFLKIMRIATAERAL